jgi:CBS domain-containing protein
MSPLVLMIGPGHTLRQAARLMRGRRVGAAVVHDVDGVGYGILTERDILTALAADQNPDVELAGNHMSREVVVADPDWPLDTAAAAMLRGGFRHLLVCADGEVAGVLSMRDVVGCWSRERVTA